MTEGVCMGNEVEMHGDGEGQEVWKGLWTKEST